MAPAKGQNRRRLLFSQWDVKIVQDHVCGLSQHRCDEAYGLRIKGDGECHGNHTQGVSDEIPADENLPIIANRLDSLDSLDDGRDEVHDEKQNQRNALLRGQCLKNLLLLNIHLNALRGEDSSDDETDECRPGIEALCRIFDVVNHYACFMVPKCPTSPFINLMGCV